MNGFSGTYDLDPIGWSGGLRGKMLYEFRNSAEDPLTYESQDGMLIRPDNHFITDLGSVPLTLQALIPAMFAKDRWIRSFCNHDSAYLHGGYWLAVAGGWKFSELTRRQADDMLREMILAEGGGSITARLIWYGVRAGGWASWKRKVPPSDTMPLTPAIA